MRLFKRMMMETAKRYRRGFNFRPPRSRKFRDYVGLSDDAMEVIRGIADDTGSTPEDVLKESVALYKLVLDKRKASVAKERQQHSPTSA